MPFIVEFQHYTQRLMVWCPAGLQSLSVCTTFHEPQTLENHQNKYARYHVLGVRAFYFIPSRALMNILFLLFPLKISFNCPQYSGSVNSDNRVQIIVASFSSKSIHFSLMIISVLDEFKSKSRFPQISTTNKRGKRNCQRILNLLFFNWH